MSSHFKTPDAGVNRHDLVFVSPGAWHSLLTTRSDLAEVPLARKWVDEGRPLAARRFAPNETSGLPLGLPLPPLLGKRHLSLLMQIEDVASSVPPLPLSLALEIAPFTWRPSLRRVVALAAEQGVEVRTFGSLAWQTLTGLNYLTPNSDVDVLLPFSRGCDVAQLTSGLAAIEADAPMRLDGELVNEAGLGVNWREVHSGAREVLAKTKRRVVLIPAAQFLGRGGAA